jgi:thiol-disulfide isomerase/thioredoxin
MMFRGRTTPWLAAALGVCASGAACDEAEPRDPDPQSLSSGPGYPAGPYAIAEGETLPNLAFDGLTAEGVRATLRFSDFLAPEDGEPRLLVVQVSGGLWCGTCRWTASHFDETLGAGLRAKVDRFDLVVRNRDNGPASAELDPLAWR